MVKQENGVAKREQPSFSLDGDCDMKWTDMNNNDVIILEPHEVKAAKTRDPTKNFRGNLVKTFRIFETIKSNIRADHLTAMKRTPFFNFWSPFLNGSMKQSDLLKSDVVLRKMICKYSVRERGFRFGSKILKLTTEDVDLVFGIKSGTIELGLDNSSPKPESEFARRRAALENKENMDVSEINKELAVLVNSRHDVDISDFVKLLCAHSLYTVFDSTSGITVPNWIISIVDDLEGLNGIAWNKYVVDKLNLSLVKSHLVPENTIGCVLLLGYLMLEHSDLVAPVNPNGIPRFTKWKMSDLKEEYMDLDDVILSRKVDVSPLVKTDDELAHNVFIKAVSGGTYPATLEELRSEFIVMRSENERLRQQVQELSQRCDMAENKYYNEVAVRRDVETCLDDSIVEAGVHCITQAFTDDKTFSALKDEIAAKDQIIADMRDQIKARDLYHELNDLSPNFSANRVSNGLVQSGVGLRMMLENEPGIRKIAGHSGSSASMVASGSSSKHGSANDAMIPVETETNITCNDMFTLVPPDTSRAPKRDKRSAGSIEKGVKFNPRPRQRNKKYEDVEPVAFGVINDSSERVLAGHKDAYEVGKYLSGEDFSIIQLSYMTDRTGLRNVIYTAPKSPHKVIRVEDVYDILVKDKISNEFIECFNELLSEYISSEDFTRKMFSRKQIDKNRIGPKILFMPANTWTYVSEGWSGCLDEIHEKLNRHAQNPVDHIVVPLNSSGQGNYEGLHWTLMVYYVKNKTWDFYNSLPVGNLLEDQHRLDAVIVAKYIEAYMRHGEVKPQLTAGVHVNLQNANCPKQDPEKPDCGVFMCYVLKQLIDGKPISVKLQHFQILNFRANMIHWAVNELI